MGKQWQYGIVFDAGSSGTRLYVYRWEDPRKGRLVGSKISTSHLPRLILQRTKKTRPGISSFASNPSDIGPLHIQALIDVALNEVPMAHAVKTPIYLMATAGMRLLEESQQQRILDEICSFFTTKTPFLLTNCKTHVQIISGETEGLYGWIAANYLLGGFDENSQDHGNGHHTIGFLDMGGASAQIAFAPNTSETEKHFEDLKMVRLRKTDGQNLEYQVFVASWLGFGANQARYRYLEELYAMTSHISAPELSDPCMPKGLRITKDGRAEEMGSKENYIGPVFVGTGKFGQCMLDLYPLLGKEAPCRDNPCLLAGKHVPAIDFGVNHFIGVSEFWHTTHGIFGKDKEYDLQTFQKRVMEFCSRDWTEIKADLVSSEKPTEEKIRNAQEACFKAAWLISVLYDGIGIPRLGTDDSTTVANVSKLEDENNSGFLEAFMPVNKIAGVDLSWTLGKMVLYSSAEVPATKGSLPVGYGSNGLDLTDFEQAGLAGVKGAGLLNSPASYGTWQFLAVITILLAMCLFLRRRETRQQIREMTSCCKWRPAGTGQKSSGRGYLTLANRLFGYRSDLAYELIMEEGSTEQSHGDQTELEDFSDAGNYNESHVLSTRRTLKRKAEPHLDARQTHAALIDRSGLVVRTESRERLSTTVQILNAGRKSRAGSPIRVGDR